MFYAAAAWFIYTNQFSLAALCLMYAIILKLDRIIDILETRNWRDK